MSRVRKAYEKPAVRRVRLVLEEAILCPCKYAGMTFDPGGDGYQSCIQQNCGEPGS